MSSEGLEERRKQLWEMLQVHPRRQEVVASLEEFLDHNPQVLEDCPDCRGSGRRTRCERDDEGLSTNRDPCGTCQETGISGKLVPYFPEDNEVIDVAANKQGAIRCPGCGKHITKRSKLFTGLRCRKCGQRINRVMGT